MDQKAKTKTLELSKSQSKIKHFFYNPGKVDYPKDITQKPIKENDRYGCVQIKTHTYNLYENTMSKNFLR